MAKDQQDGVYVATESGTCEVDGESLTFVKGVTRVRVGHPLLEAVPDYFKPVEDAVHHEWERATAAPGEKRGDPPPPADEPAQELAAESSGAPAADPPPPATASAPRGKKA